jgi:hypothetical protein
MSHMTMTADLRDQTLRVAGRIEPELMTGAQAREALEDLAIADKAMAGTLLFLALRVARTNGWQGQGFKSPEDWLASQLGCSVSEARRQLGTARKADKLDKTKDAMKKGKISPDQADPVADAATADPAAEEDLLDLAERDTQKNLKDEAAKRKAAATDTETRDRRIHRERSGREWIDRNGAWNMHLTGTAADGARFAARARPVIEQIFRTGRTDGTRDTFENRFYDAALALMGVGSPASPAAPGPGPGPGEASGPEPADHERGADLEPVAAPPSPVKRAGGSNVKVIVRIDHTALTRGYTVAGETCDIAGLGPVSVETVKDLMGDAFLAAVVMKGRDVVNVAHLGRGPNAFQRTALEAAGFACRNICCNRTVNIEADHRVPYATNHETRLDNLDLLCRGNGGCHDLKTHHGHELEEGTGRRRLLPPDHPDHPSNKQRTGPDTDTGPPERTRIEQPALC